jgi:hypothetical protein
MSRTEREANHVHLVARSTMTCQYFYTDSAAPTWNITISLRICYRNTRQTPSYTRKLLRTAMSWVRRLTKTEVIISFINLIWIISRFPILSSGNATWWHNNALSFARRKHRYARDDIVISGNCIRRLRFLLTYLFVQLLRWLSAPCGTSVNVLWICYALMSAVIAANCRTTKLCW